MNYKLLFTIAAFAAILWSCEKNEITEQSARAMKIVATVQELPQTKSTLEETESGAIRFKWEAGDVVHFAFVQGTTKKAVDGTVSAIANEGRTATFNIEVPAEITGDFTLYAYRSDGDGSDSKLLDENPVIAVLPKYSWEYLANFDDQRKLFSFWGKTDVTYSGGTMPDVSLAFKHLGAMMTVKVNNTTGADITDVFTIDFKGTKPWVRNHLGGGGAQFNMETASYVSGKEWINSSFDVVINTESTTNSIPSGVSSYYQWFAPGNYEATNEIYAVLKNFGNADIGTTTTPKKAIDFQPGKSYVVYLKIGGTPGSYTVEYSNAAWE